ncbi:hypothetical protein GCM10025865_29700 [Paraoerskovia sediminicola]|uniref:PH domain-containing protein n=1 Tax=Paraoerskovia sediminicola TaxID=1138587 RepID=A0ABM8G687_9CELL|nr:hypothetical protein GCM10025865_29700 [Paraoerskovia sediminicola]
MHEVPALPVVPDPLSAATVGPFPATYVSTTLAGDWLARVGAHGLGDRAAATVSLHPEGLLVERQGAETVFVAASRIEGVDTTPGMAGKVTGGEGILVVTWRLGGPQAGADEESDLPTTTLLDTGLNARRSADRDELLDAVRGLVARRTARVDEGTDEATGEAEGQSGDPASEPVSDPADEPADATRRRRPTTHDSDDQEAPE